jgi:hypothetical protein
LTGFIPPSLEGRIPALTRILFPWRDEIFPVSEAGTHGNIRSEARLFQQRMRGAVSRAEFKPREQEGVSC